VKYKVDSKMSDGWINQRFICDLGVAAGTRARVSPVASCCRTSNIFGYRGSLIFVRRHLRQLTGNRALLICSTARRRKTPFVKNDLRARQKRGTPNASIRPIESCSDGGHGQSSCRRDNRNGGQAKWDFRMVVKESTSNYLICTTILG